MAYLHYAMVNSDYQGRGLGMAMVKMLLEIYRDFPHIVLVANDCSADFFRKIGFVDSKGAGSMEIRRM